MLLNMWTRTACLNQSDEFNVNECESIFSGLKADERKLHKKKKSEKNLIDRMINSNTSFRFMFVLGYANRCVDINFVTETQHISYVGVKSLDDQKKKLILLFFCELRLWNKFQPWPFFYTTPHPTSISSVDSLYFHLRLGKLFANKYLWLFNSNK